MAASRSYRTVRSGVETLPAGLRLPRHRHRDGYATVVLAGRFIEASFAGRFEASPGHVLLHAHFDCHSNDAFRSSAPQILRLPWNHAPLEGRFVVKDVDRLVRLAERDPHEASHELAAALLPCANAQADWPEDLARDLTANPSLSLADWARARRLAPETVSRGFGRTFGVTPKLFRLEARTRCAWGAIVGSTHSLTVIAHSHHFADLAHMSRSVSAFTGASPMAWRRAVTPERLRDARPAAAS